MVYGSFGPSALEPLAGMLCSAEFHAVLRPSALNSFLQPIGHALGALGAYPESPSTQYSRTLVPKTIPFTGSCQNYGPVLGPSILRHLVFRGPKRGP